MSGPAATTSVAVVNNDSRPLEARPDTLVDTLREFAADVVHPVRPDADPGRRRLLRARQVVALVAAAATLVQVIVWLMIALAGGGLDAPWWLWTAVPALGAVAVLTGVERFRARVATP